MGPLRAWATVGLLALLGPPAAVAAGIIEGRVPVAEAPPPPALDQRYLQKVTGPIAAPDPPVSVVWVEGGGASPRRDGARAEVQQVQFQFNPGLLVVPVGTAVAFPNRDDTYHSIFSYSEPKRFDLGRYLKDEAPPAVVFDKPGLVRLFCEIHERPEGVCRRELSRREADHACSPVASRASGGHDGCSARLRRAA